MWGVKTGKRRKPVKNDYHANYHVAERASLSYPTLGLSNLVIYPPSIPLTEIPGKDAQSPVHPATTPAVAEKASHKEM